MAGPADAVATAGPAAGLAPERPYQAPAMNDTVRSDTMDTTRVGLLIGAPRGRAWRLADDHRPHHVVLLMLEDVAVPHVLEAAGPRAGGRDELRRAGQVEPGDHVDHLARVHPDGLLPAGIVGQRSHRRTLEVRHARVGVHRERLPRDDLEVDEVEVDRVRVRGQVGDLPDLG